MKNQISANDLKTKGVTILDTITAENDEAVITVRGRSRYVVIPVEKYNQLREHELEAALRETREDLKAGRITRDSISEHISRITGV